MPISARVAAGSCEICKIGVEVFFRGHYAKDENQPRRRQAFPQDGNR